MATDKKGKAIEVGDEIVIRGRVVAISWELQDESTSIIQVSWDEKVPLLDFVRSGTIEVAKGRE